MCYDFGIFSGPLLAGSLAGGGAAAGGGAVAGGVAAGSAVGASAVVGGGVTAAGLGSGAIGTGLTASQLAAMGATSAVVGTGGYVAPATFLGMGAGGWGLATQLSGTLMGTVGAIGQGRQQKAAYEANAKTQDMQARDAQRRGSVLEGQAREQSKMITGAVNANQGGSGVIAGQDTGLDILAESAEFGARDAAMMRINADREAWGFKAGAGNDRFQGQMAGNAGVYRAGTTFMSGVSDAFMPPPPWWEKWKRP